MNSLSTGVSQTADQNYGSRGPVFLPSDTSPSTPFVPTQIPAGEQFQNIYIMIN